MKRKIRWIYCLGLKLVAVQMHNRALAYCQGLVQQPQETILVLISDLYEGGDRTEMLQRIAALAGFSVQFIAFWRLITIDFWFMTTKSPLHWLASEFPLLLVRSINS